MNWKKVSEHPLPKGDGKKLYIVCQIYNGEIVTSSTTYFPDGNAFSTHWIEVEFPPKEEIKKDPTIELWSVWEGLANGSLCVLKDIQNGYYSLYDIESPHLSVKTNSLAYYKPRPDLEVRAPAILYTECDGYHCQAELTYRRVDNKVRDTAPRPIRYVNKDSAGAKLGYKWPASLSQMIVVPKEKK